MGEKVSRRIHYAWIILAVSFIGVLAAQGVRFTFGAFMESWEGFFSTNRGTISAISFVSFIVYGLSQPIVGKLLDKYGVKKIFVISIFIVGTATLLSCFVTSVWQLFILYGVVGSLGFGGASGVTATVAVTKWFSKKKGLALGIVEAGFGAGQMLLVPSSILLIEAFGWQWTVLILGSFLIFIVCPILALFLKSEPSEVGLTALGAEGAIDLDSKASERSSKEQDLRAQKLNKQQTQAEQSSKQQPLSRPSMASRKFWFLLIPFFVCGFTTTGLMDTHLIPFAQFCGFSPVVTSAAFSTLAAFNVLGILVAGVLADRWNNKKILTFLYFARALTILFLFVFSSSLELMKIFLHNPALLLIFSISFGLVDFATVPPTIKLLSDYFKGQSLGLLTGWLFMGHQIGSALGSYIPGLLFDQTNSYQLSFLFAFVLLIAAGIFCAFLPKIAENK